MNKRFRTEQGQAAVLLALGLVALLAFAALAIDGGQAYLTRRNAQNAADAAAIAGTRELYRLKNDPGADAFDPESAVLRVINDAAERNSVPDTNGIKGDTMNDYVLAYYLDEDANRLEDPTDETLDFVVGALGLVPEAARGVEVEVDIPQDAFLAFIVGQDNLQASAGAAALFTERTGRVSAAIWANGDNCDPNTLKLTGSYQVVGGGIHSNGDVQVNGNASEPSVYTGTLEYVTNVAVSGAYIIDPPDNQPSPGIKDIIPLLFEIEDFAPGGDFAVEAGADYHYLVGAKIQNNELEAAGLLDDDGNLTPGLYFTDGHFELNGSLTGVGVTFVSRGHFWLSGSEHYFEPYHPQLLIFSLDPGAPSCNTTAIKVSASSSTWYGLIYAPYGAVNMSNASNTGVYGSIIGWTVDLSGSEVEIHYREEYDPQVPPKVILIW